MNRKNTCAEEDVHIPAWYLKRQYKVSNFGLKVEIRWSLGVPPVCVFRPSHYFTKRFPAREEKYLRTHSDYSFFTQMSSSKNKTINYILYIYEFFVVCPVICDRYRVVQFSTKPKFGTDCCRLYFKFTCIFNVIMQRLVQIKKTC